jgi:hypothetical protein
MADIDKIYEQLHKSSRYLGKKQAFLLDSTWTECIGYRSLCRKNGQSTKISSLVGVISPRNLFMEPYGDFGVHVNELQDASLRFSLTTPPPTYPKFREDFKTSMETLADVTHSIGLEFQDSSKVFSPDQPAVHFSHRIFIPEVSIYSTLFERYSIPNLR